MHHGGDEDGWLCWCSYSIIPTRLTPSIKGREPRAAGKWQQGQITRAKPWRCETPPGMKKATGSCGVALAGRTRAPCSPLCQHSMSLPAVGPLPSPCPGSRMDLLPMASPAAGAGLGLQLTPGPPGPPASTCMEELHRAKALQGAKTFTTTSALQGCRNLGSVRPAVGKTAGRESPVSSSSHGSQSRAPGGAQQHLGRAHSPLHWMHNAAVIY